MVLRGNNGDAAPAISASTEFLPKAVLPFSARLSSKAGLVSIAAFPSKAELLSIAAFPSIGCIFVQYWVVSIMDETALLRCLPCTGQNRQMYPKAKDRACLKNHSCHLYAPFCVIFALNSGYIDRYASIYLAQIFHILWHIPDRSIYQTRSRACQ